MNLRDIKVGVIGTGFMGVAHIDTLRTLGVHVAGVVGSTPERAQAKIGSRNLPIVDSVAALVADQSIDVVHIASPNAMHADQARLCLEAGKHVVCEKPMGVGSNETASLAQLAAKSDLVNAVCFNLRFYPQVHQMAAMIRSGEIGRPRMVTGHYFQDWLLLESDWNWRLDPAVGGEMQAIADIGSHWVDMARFVAGQDIVEVMADFHTFVQTRQQPPHASDTFAGSGDDAARDHERTEVAMSNDDAASVLFRFADGARGAVTVSQVAAGRKNSLNLEVHGSTDSIGWISESPDELWVGHRGRGNETVFRDPASMYETAAAVSHYPVGHVEGYPDTIRGLFSRVYADVIKGGPSATPSYPTFADGHDAMLVTEAIASSARSRQWKPVIRTAPLDSDVAYRKVNS